jgi:hypothetical protein
MDIILNDLEILLLFTTLFSCAVFFCSVQLYKFILYNKRSLNYQFYAVRDELIECVALNLISKDDKLFTTFYSASNDLIGATNTDFFSLRLFLKAVKSIDNKEDKIYGKSQNLVSDIRKRPKQFQNAVENLFFAIENTFIKKNLLLRVFVGSIHNAYIMKKIFNKILTINTIMKKPLAEQKQYLDEYKKIEKLRLSLSPATA